MPLEQWVLFGLLGAIFISVWAGFNAVTNELGDLLSSLAVMRDQLSKDLDRVHEELRLLDSLAVISHDIDECMKELEIMRLKITGMN